MIQIQVRLFWEKLCGCMMTFLDGKNTGTAECAKYYEFQCVLLNVTPSSK